MLNIEKIKQLIEQLKRNSIGLIEFDEDEMYSAYTSGYFDGREGITARSSYEEHPYLRQMYEAGYRDGNEDRQVEASK